MTGSPTIARIPLNTLAISLGAAGLAELWSGAVESLGLPGLIGEAFWVLAAVVWVWMITAHVIRGARSAATLHSQLVHPVQGPIAALVPIVGMLLGGNLHAHWAVGGSILVVASIVAAALYMGWLLASWMHGGALTLESVHGGYFLPTVAVSYVASYAAATIGAVPLAIGAFAVGSFFWIAMFTLLFARLALRPALPDPLVPTLAIMMAPPAVAASAWFVIDGGVVDGVEQGLAALAVIMVLVELALLPTFLRLKFSLGFWSFTFPTAYVAALGVAWLHLEQPVGWQVITVALVVGVTALIVAIAVRSIALWSAGRPGSRDGASIAAGDSTGNTAETELAHADQAAAAE